MFGVLPDPQMPSEIFLLIFPLHGILALTQSNAFYVHPCYVFEPPSVSSLVLGHFYNSPCAMTQKEARVDPQ